jgi:hypothetical protein
MEIVVKPFEGAGLFVLRVVLESKSVFCDIRAWFGVLALTGFEAGVCCVFG